LNLKNKKTVHNISHIVQKKPNIRKKQQLFNRFLEFHRRRRSLYSEHEPSAYGNDKTVVGIGPDEQDDHQKNV